MNAASANLVERLRAVAAARPAQAAIVTGVGRSERSISFGDLDRRAAIGAAGLVDAGVRPGDRVLLLVPMSIELYVALVAILRIGAVASFVDPSAGIARLDAACRRLRPKAVVARGRGQLLRLLSGGVRSAPIRVTIGWRWLPATRWRSDGGAAPIAPRSADDPAVVTATSGSTGEPKLAARSHGLLDAQRAAILAALGLRAGQSDLATLPLFVLANLAAGVTSVIAAADLRSPGAIDAAPLLAQIRTHRIATTVASPALVRRLVDAATSNDLASLRLVATGGAPLFWHDLDRFAAAASKARILLLYGSTEAEPIAEIAYDELSADDRAATCAGLGLPAGRPIPTIRLRVIEERWGTPIGSIDGAAFDAMRCPVGRVGEIVVAGPHVLPGYVDGVGDEETKFRVDGEPWHRTGDTGHLDADGRLWLAGRAAARTRDREGILDAIRIEAAAHLAAPSGIRRAALLPGTRTLVVETEDPELEGVLAAALEPLGIRSVRRLPRIPVDRRHNAKIDYPALLRRLG